jgi:glycolate oxidase iron-sulfur subunit
MRTQIPAELQDEPDIATMDAILRKCVHCGFCLSACPTYSVSSDERQSPRGRIYLLKSLIEDGPKEAPSILSPIDSCLSCLACASACPSGVDYQHFIDLARPRLEEAVARTPLDRLTRAFVAFMLPHPRRFAAVLRLARLAKPFRVLLPRRWRAMLDLAPDRRPGAVVSGDQDFPGGGRARVALLAGCAQQPLRPSINQATIRLLNRMRLDVVVRDGGGCCGALLHHLGRGGEDFARARIAAWDRAGPLDAVVTNAAGCGTHVKDYGFILRGTSDEAAGARVAALARDISEVVAQYGLPPIVRRDLPPVVYHDACSLLHGQKQAEAPRALLRAAGFDVREAVGKHYCCGSAGSYNMLQPDMAEELGHRRAAVLEASGAAVIATGNIGCLEQLRRFTPLPIVHTVELLDWATGGPPPPELDKRP